MQLRAPEFLEQGLKKFIDKYTSFGQGAMNSGNDRNDGFLLELLLRYAPPSVVQNETSKSDIVSSLQKKELRVKPLSHYAS
jgi:hypothetical protein